MATVFELSIKKKLELEIEFKTHKIRFCIVREFTEAIFQGSFNGLTKGKIQLVFGEGTVGLVAQG